MIQERSRYRITTGRVLDEFCRRVLSRRVVHSNVLVMTPDVYEEKVIEKVEGGNELVKTLMGRNVVMEQSIQNDHSTYILPAFTNIGKWWKQKNTNNSNKPTWFLLTYILGGESYEDGGRDIMSIDEILHPSRVKEFFNDATLTYIVIGVHSKINQLTGKISVTGISAVQTLLDFNYKVQLLASSHFGGEVAYHHNHLFKDTEDLQLFLSLGAKMSQNDRFEALLFATQGLDLAIPSRLSYINLDNANYCVRGNELNKTGRCDSKMNWAAMKDDVFMSCPTHHDDLYLFFDKRSPIGVRVFESGKEISHEKSRDFDLWLGHKDVSSAEAACIRIRKPDGLSKVACATRIIKQDPPLLASINIFTKDRPKQNVIFILIDPISRSQLRRSLPNTHALLDKLGFANFNKYTAVGDNSGPNQAALYTGRPLVGGRDGIRDSNTHNSGEKSTWLWDELASEGYVTLKAEDVCIQNSNMVRS